MLLSDCLLARCMMVFRCLLAIAALGIQTSHAAWSNLAELLPPDLDQLAPSISKIKFMNAVGAQILLYAGFQPLQDKWVKVHPLPANLTQRYQLIQPTWKSGGPVDYSSDALQSSSKGTAIFDVANSGGTAVGAEETVASMAAAVEAKGFEMNDLDVQSQIALRDMLSWNLPAVPLHSPVTSLFVFSFDATPECINITDCPLPGPSNELIAATVEQFVQQSSETVEVYAQWEIASALFQSSKVPRHHVHPAGAAGVYMNTVQILNVMSEALKQQKRKHSLVAVLAHPDHIRRAYRTVRTEMPHIAAVPAMMPYSLAWPENRSEGSVVNLYKEASAEVHTEGQIQRTSWYSKSMGYFPDAYPQMWVHNRDVWILYDHWAVAKGIATGIINPSLSAVTPVLVGQFVGVNWSPTTSCLVVSACVALSCAMVHALAWRKRYSSAPSKQESEMVDQVVS